MTSQHEIAESLGLPVHPPKVEVFDLVAGTNTDSKGVVRPVDEFRRERFGLYMARPIVDHPKLAYLESWLLPELNLRVSDYRWKPGHERDQDFYLDVVSVTSGAHRWRSVDLYLDIVVFRNRFAEVLDTDEFVTALRAELLDERIAQLALTTTHTTVDALARHDYDTAAWLRSLGVELRRRSPTTEENTQ
ncbi:DUF402 domain-containing protein [Actinopolyspora mortivallis]|uniref:DUF402 domain-containing protein n=1 Tax=Actinopolyspora mortivallis TaxID=33906 RepID=UPI00037D4984|nr:DUF402 domain-containing protein [Actinopolyspora mortivallis]